MNSLAFAQTNRGVTVRPSGTDSSKEKRIALVIGNGAYQKTTPLTNPVNDATDVANALRELGFEVLFATDADKRQIESLMRQFGDKLAESKGVGLFYYAGHGVQVNGENYILPVEAELPAEDEVKFAAVPIGFVLAKMETAKNSLNLIILDACRNNPFARSWRNYRDVGQSGGLAKITPPTGTLVLYATQPGNVAADGDGRNGLFTESLLKQIRQPNIEYDQMVRLLARDVAQKSGGKQLPWKEGISLVDFYFASNNKIDSSQNSPVLPDTVVNKKDRTTIEREAWQLIQNSNNPADFRSFLQEFPNGSNSSNAQIKLEQSVWDSIKNTSEKFKIQSYLNEFPNGANAPLARIKLRQFDVLPNSSITMPVSTSNPTTYNNEPNSQQNKDSLYTRFTGCYKDTDVQRRNSCYQTAKEFLDRYERDNDEYTTFVRKKYDAWVLTDRKNNILTRFDTAAKNSNADEAFASATDVLTISPELTLDVSITLASMGFDAAVAKNDKFNIDALNYAKIAIQQIESGKLTLTGNYGTYSYSYKSNKYPDGKSNALGYMYYTVGYIMYNRLNQKKEALSYYYKATLLNSGTMTTPDIYRTIGSWYADEFIKLEKERNNKIAAAGNQDTDETKKLLALELGYAERAADAYARAYKLVSPEPANQAYKDSLLARSKQLYGIRNNNDVSGFDAYLSDVANTTFVDPTTEVVPVNSK